MDVFQGCYKNGTRDCRYFAAVYPILRLLVLVEYAITFSVFFYPTAVVTLIITAMLVAVVRPYRYPMYNIVNVILLLILAIVYNSVYANAVINSSPHFLGVSMMMIGLSLLLTFIYGTVLLIRWLKFAGGKMLPQAVLQWLESLLTSCRNVRNSDNMDNSRLEHTRVSANRLVLFPGPVGDGEGESNAKASSQRLSPYECKRNYGTV